MLILDYPDWIQSTLSFQLIPKAAYEMTPELSVIDKLLEDETYEEPIIKRFNTLRGRPTVPVRVYIRPYRRLAWTTSVPTCFGLCFSPT